MSKEKIAFVVCRYGKEINGGAEYSCRVQAEHLADVYDVEILTSCAKRNDPWDNYYPEGEVLENGVKVRRFLIEDTSEVTCQMSLLEKKMEKGDVQAAEEWIKGIGPYCPSLINYLKENASQYKKVIFVTYAIYPTVMGIKLGLENAILMPTAHDEPHIYRRIYEDVFRLVKGYVFHSVEERELVVNMFGVDNIPSYTTCVGFDLTEVDHVVESKNIYKNYVVYVGRVSNGKNFPQLNQYFMEYKRRNPSDLKLLVLGTIENNLQITCSSDIIYLGFVSEKDKYSIMKNAQLLCMPSKHESLSWVLLESMALERPVLVNEECKVMKGQCERSNAGLYYSNYLEFEKCLNFLLNKENENVYQEMGKNGKKYVEETYNWANIINNLVQFLDEEN